MNARSTWPLASFLDIISAAWVAYGGWVTISALLRWRPKDIARLASRVVYDDPPAYGIEYEFDEADAWKHARESVDAGVGTRFLIAGAAFSILAHELPRGGVLDAAWIAAAVVLAAGAAAVAERWRRRHVPRFVSQSFLAWLESLTPDPARPVSLGRLPIPVFAVAWRHSIDALRILVCGEVGDQWAPTTAEDYDVVERAVRTLGRRCSWKPEEPAWNAFLNAPRVGESQRRGGRGRGPRSHGEGCRAPH